MRIKTLMLALAAMLGLCFSSGARADITLDLANLPTTEILFTGTGTGANYRFTNDITGSSFVITGSTNGSDSIGDKGALSGIYSYTAVTTSGGVQSATVTGSGTLTIHDKVGPGVFTGTVAGVDIVTVGTGGTINSSATVNLSGVSYTGSGADLTNLKNDAILNGGTVAMTFTFIPAQTLNSLKHGSHHTSYSGTINASSTPEPSTFVVAGIGALGMIGFGLRRRKALGV
jgi:hypothetical protein